MNRHSKHTDARVTDLQARLTDVNSRLVEALGTGKWRDTATRSNLKIAIRDIIAIRDEIARACPCNTETGAGEKAEDKVA